MSYEDNPRLDGKIIRYLNNCTLNAVTTFGDSLTLHGDIIDMNELGWELIQMIPQRYPSNARYEGSVFNIFVWRRITLKP